ncbi:MAG: hypothetical protein KC420_02875 [Myxococcales bacterium]|nr:hypothetical protein [Myxococcales bacterium]MCB9570188.1 hypothetical protein [Myxococcales bacterium]MCB9700804.1 hypothetical protein [Myxococcales bacterium]
MHALAVAAAVMTPLPASAQPAGAGSEASDPDELDGPEPDAEADMSDPAVDAERLLAVREVAHEELAERFELCISVMPEAGQAGRQELAFVEIAGMLSHFFNTFAYGENLADRTYDALGIAEAFRRAFECAPDWEKRHYLAKALDVIELRLRELETERRPEVEEERTSLEATRTILKDRQDALRAPKAEEAPPPAPAPKPTAEEPSGYAQRWRERLSLRVEVGGGEAALKEAGRQRSELGTLALDVGPGVRFLAGKRRRHVIGVGFNLGFYRLAVAYLPVPQWTYTMTTDLAYGYRIHPRWFSAHLAFEAGLQTNPRGESFGREILGGSFALCTWSEAACVRVRALSTLPGAPNYMDGLAVLGGLDVFRMVDNLLRKRAETR